MDAVPGVVTFRHDDTDRIYVYLTGSSGHLYTNYWDGVDEWLWAHQGRCGLAHAPVALTSWQFHGIEEQHMHVYVVGSDGRLYQNWWNESNWHPWGSGWFWLDHGPPAPNVAAASSPGVLAYRRQSTGQLHDVFDRIDAFVAGSDGRLYRHTWDGRQENWFWRDQGSLPRANTIVSGAPTAVAYYHEGTKRIYAFVRGNDGRLYVNYSRNTQINSAWDWADLGKPSSAGATLDGEPAAITYRHEGRERIYVFARGSDGHLHVCFWNGVDRWEWADLGRPRPAGVTILDRPAMLRYHHDGTDRLYVFVRGSDGHLHVCYWNGVDRWEWADLGTPRSTGTTVTSGPGAVNFHYDGTDRMYAFVRGSDGHLHVCFWDGVDTWRWADQGRPPTAIAITGVEQTQAIQFFRPALSPCPDRPGAASCPANAIALVAGKATVLRVYVDVSQGSIPVVTQVSGLLETRLAGETAWVQHTPLHAPIAARRDADIDRGIADHTLNFRIPAERCQGTVEVRVSVFDPGGAGHSCAPLQRTLQFANVVPLRIRLIRIRYQNAARGMNLQAPTTADFWTTAQFTLKTYPIGAIRIEADSEELYDGDFTGLFDAPPGAIGTTGSVFTIIDRLAIAEGRVGDPRVKYFALIPGAPANQSGALGWGVGPNRAVGEVFQGAVMAQEIGHTCGRGHAPCSVPDPDPNYPAYGSYPSGSIGEYGFDTVDSTVYDPAAAKDFMSYCFNPAWVSPYTYEALANSCFPPVSGVRAAGADGAAASERELLFMPVTIDRSGKVVPRAAGLHLRGFWSPPSGHETPYTVELRDATGRILERARLHMNDMHRSLEDPQLDFLVVLPWHANSRSLVFKRGEDRLYDVKIGEAAPQVGITYPRGDLTLRGKQKVVWSARGSGAPITYALRYSNDGGESWRAVATGLTVTEHAVDMDSLPGGNRCVFQVLASERMRTAVVTSDPFVVPIKPRKISVISPRRGDTFTQGDSIHLFAVVSLPEGASVMSDALRWTSSLDGYLGSGSQVVVRTLSAGKHLMTVRVGDAVAGETHQSVVITIHPKRSGAPPGAEGLFELPAPQQKEMRRPVGSGGHYE